MAFLRTPTNNVAIPKLLVKKKTGQRSTALCSSVRFLSTLRSIFVYSEVLPFRFNMEARPLKHMKNNKLLVSAFEAKGLNGISHACKPC